MTHCRHRDDDGTCAILKAMAPGMSARNLCGPCVGSWDASGDESPAFIHAVVAQVSGTQSREEPPLPGFLEITTNFASAMAKWAAAGFPVVDEATFRERMATCEGCDAWRPSDGRCSLCGCYCGGRTGKANLSSSECPKGLWVR